MKPESITQVRGAADAAATRREFLRMAAGSVGAWTIAAADGNAQSPADWSRLDYIDAHAHVWSGDTAHYPLKSGFTKQQMILPSFMPEELFDKSQRIGSAADRADSD